MSARSDHTQTTALLVGLRGYTLPGRAAEYARCQNRPTARPEAEPGVLLRAPLRPAAYVRPNMDRSDGQCGISRIGR